MNFFCLFFHPFVLNLAKYVYICNDNIKRVKCSLLYILYVFIKTDSTTSTCYNVTDK